MRIIEFIKRNQKKWEVALIMLIIIGIYSLPHILRTQFLSNEGLLYQPLSLVKYFDEVNVTGARMHEILDGVILVSEIDTFEHKKAPAFLPMLPPLLLAPFTLLTQSVNAATILAQSILPGVFALMFYAWAHIITEGKHRLSLFFTIIASLFPRWGLFIIPTSINQLKELIVNVLPWQHKLYTDRLSINRMESMVPDFLIFGPALIFLFRAIITQRKQYFIWFGVFLGLLFYTYVFYWIFLVIVCGLYMLYALYHKQWHTTQWLGISGGIALIISSFYFYHYWQISQLPSAELIKDAVWIEYTHAFRWGAWKHYIVLLIVGCATYALINEKNKKIATLILSFLAASVIVLNIQVITGFNIQPDHWPERTGLISINIACLFILSEMFNRLQSSRTRNVLKILLIIIGISQITGSTHLQYVYARSDYKNFAIDRTLSQTLKDINNIIKTDEVVLSRRLSIHYFIPTYTHGRIYLPRAINTISTLEERFERLVIASRLFGRTNEEVYALFDTQKNNLNTANEAIEDYDARGLLYFFSGAALPQSIDGYKQNDNRYQLKEAHIKILDDALARAPSFNQEMLTRYKLDYILMDPISASRVFVNLDEYTFLEKIYDQNGYTLYRVVTDNKKDSP